MSTHYFLHYISIFKPSQLAFIHLAEEDEIP